MSETMIKNKILDYLKYQGIYCWLTNTQGNYNKITNTWYKNQRLKKGVADILGITNKGRFFAIECKFGKNKQTNYQKSFQIEVESRKGIYILAYSLKDVIDKMYLLIDN